MGKHLVGKVVSDRRRRVPECGCTSPGGGTKSSSGQHCEAEKSGDEERFEIETAIRFN